MFENPPGHHGNKMTGQTLEWMPTDSRESFEHHMRDTKHRRYLQKMGWDRPGAITYRINSQGFRGDDFGSGDYLVALGCSFTIGIGLPEQAVWPYLLGRRLGLKVANLAWGGYSADTCYRLARYWVPRLSPKLVVMLTPPMNRIELLVPPEISDDLGFDVFMPNDLSKLGTEVWPYLKHWFFNDGNAELNREKNQLALQKLCADQSIPCEILDCDKFMNFGWEDIGKARDFMHGGPPAHLNIVAAIMQRWERTA